MSPLASSGNPADFVCCRPTADNALILEYYTGPGGAVSIPEAIDGRPVTRVHGNAFTNRPSLTSAMFSGKAPTVDWSAFKGSSPEFKVCYLTGSSGFSSPIWQSYPAEGLAKLPDDKK